MTEYCYGCKKKHDDFHWQTRTADGKTAWVCRLWFSTAVSQEKRMQNMSSEEILSGGLAGLPNQFKTKSEDRTPAVVQRERERAREVLK